MKVSRNYKEDLEYRMLLTELGNFSKHEILKWFEVFVRMCDNSLFRKLDDDVLKKLDGMKTYGFHIEESMYIVTYTGKIYSIDNNKDTSDKVIWVSHLFSTDENVCEGVKSLLSIYEKEGK